MHIILKTGLCFLLFIFAAYSLAETSETVPPPSKTIQAEPQSNNSSEEHTSQIEEAEPEQYYIVEVILFQHLNEKAKQDEFWHHPSVITEDRELIDTPSLNATPSLTDDTPALAQYDLTNKRFLPLRNGVAVLPASNYKLADSAAHLRYSKEFHVLAHFGWTQRSFSRQNALPILINSEQFSDTLIPSGHLKLYVSRYLHMQVDLSARNCEQTIVASSEKTPIDDKQLDKQLENGTSALEKTPLMTSENISSDTAPCVSNIYQFKQQRKMRSKELHYLDNPLYGMLVYVTPYTVDTETTE